MKIVITGAKGFLGRHLVEAALQEGHGVVGIDLPGLPSMPACNANDRYCECPLDLLEWPATLPQCLADADVLIHCAARLSGPSEAVYRTNLKGTQALIEALQSQKDGLRFVFLSTMAIFEKIPGPYGCSKREAEAVVRAGMPSSTVIRPTMIYGKHDPGWTARIKERVTQKRILPLPGGGRARIQPLYVNDAAAAVLAAAQRSAAQGAAFNLGGPEAIEHGAFLLLARQRLQGKTLMIPLPLWPFTLAGRLLGGRLRAMAAFGSEDHLVDIEPARKALGFDPCPPAEGLALTFADGT